MITILSIDGGGIRGIMPAMVLAWIESYAGKSISDIFDVVGGTSTGAILSCGVTCPDKNGNPKFKASDIVLLYEMDGKTIFDEDKKRSWFSRMKFKLKGLKGSKYKTSNLVKTFDKKFGEAFLSDSISRNITCGYDIEKRENAIFDSAEVRSNKRKDIFLKDAAVSSAVAPTYFDPHRFLDVSGNVHVIVDGGAAGLNNPVSIVVDKVLDLGYTPNDIMVLSIGTGSYQERISYSDAIRFNIVQWLSKLFGIMLDGASEAVHQRMKSRLPEGNYLRIQFNLPSKKTAKMDDASRTNLDVLKDIASLEIKKVSEDIRKFIKRTNQ